MRRTNHGYESVRKGQAVFGIALAAALIGSLLPATASAAEQPAPEPTPTIVQTPEATQTPAPVDAPEATPSPTPSDVPTPDPTPTEAPEPSDTPEPTSTPTPTPTPTMTADPGEAELDGLAADSIPSPDRGDYVGDSTEDEADPGAYSETQAGLLKADTLNGFKAGNIISDAKMYTSGTMSANQIRASSTRRSSAATRTTRASRTSR